MSAPFRFSLRVGRARMPHNRPLKKIPVPPFGRISGWHRSRRHPAVSRDYFNSTLAPTFSRVALILAASSFETPSLTVFGAPSTRSFASLRPRPVIARTSLMTSIFLSPAAARTTVNSVFSSAAAAPPPPGPAATATAAAAETPHFSSSNFESSAASRTVSFESSSTIFARSAISIFLFRFEPSIDCGTASGGFALSAVCPDHTRELRCRRVHDLRDFGRRSLQEADDLRAQLVERREGSKRLHAVQVERGLAHRAAENDKFFIPLGEIDSDLGRRHRIT